MGSSVCAVADCPLSYGCTVALQYFDGRFLAMLPNGKLTLQAPTEHRWDARTVLPFRDRKDSVSFKYLFPVRTGQEFPPLSLTPLPRTATPLTLFA